METRIIVRPAFDPTWTLMEMVQKRPIEGWYQTFQDAEKELERTFTFLEMGRFPDAPLKRLMSGGKQEPGKREDFVPRAENVFRAFDLTPLFRVRVVIFGQDPYPQMLPSGKPVATGLAFSVDRETQVPSSLRNIYRELEQCIPGFKAPNHGDLTNWARQGVLLLNTSLTTKVGIPDGHIGLWEGFIDHVIRALNTRIPHYIAVLWGRNAQSLKPRLGKATVLEAAHPSGLSANRGFFGCRHFAKINEILEQRGEEPIDWSLG